MYVKKKNDKNTWKKVKNLVHYYKNHRIFAFIMTGIFIITIVSIVAVYLITYGARLHKNHYIQGYEQIAHYMIDSNFRIPINYFKGLITPRPKSLTIDIKHKNLQKIAYIRDIAFKTEVIPDSGFVPATISYKDQNYRVKIKLAGLLLDHVASDKWSLRVKLKDDKTLFGMKEFNLLHPKTRYGIYEWFCHQLNQQEGIITLRTDFVDVTINGKHNGMYQLEETFDKLLIEHNKHREGILFKPSQPLRIYQKKKIMSSQAMKKQLALLTELFYAFMDGTIEANKLFDIKKMARFYAITDLVNGFHQIQLDNIHLYFNPITGLIEPIGREWDVHFYRNLNSICGELEYKLIQSSFNQNIFSDESFFSEYIETLERISTPEYLDNFFKEIDSDLKNKLYVLYKDYPYYSFSKKYFYDNQEFIRKKLNPVNPIKVHYQKNADGKFMLFAQNLISLPIEIKSITLNDSIEFDLKKFLKPDDEQLSANFTVLPFPGNPVDLDTIPKLQLVFKLSGTSTLRKVDILPWPYQNPILSQYDLIRQEPNHDKVEFLEINNPENIISIKEGNWNLNKNLIIPGGYKVICYGNVQLNLTNFSTILCYSPLELMGSEENPISIYSSDSTGQGIVVMSTIDDESFLDHVHFENLSNPSQNGWELTGAVTFYESPVRISHCQFTKNRSEDALNIVRSKFEIDNTLFTGSFSDAFDGDFCKGNIINSSFVNCGNDAVDVSGSVVNLQNIFINNVGDKGLSAGENSQMTVDHIKINNAQIAIASKDMSTMKITNINLSESNIGFTAFQKKPEFSSANITVSGLKMDNIKTPYLVETNSTLIIDDSEIKSNQNDVKKILYGVENGQGSK